MTNTVTRNTTTWVNADGLPVRFGKGNQVDAVVGSPTVYGDDQVFIADIVFERLPKHGADQAHGMVYGDYPNSALPAGALIKSAILTPTVDYVGSSATLTLGLASADGKTEIDNNGFFDNLAVTSMQVNDGPQTGAGALVGAILATTGYLWVSVGTADFTAGQARLAITYFMPAVDANNS